VDDPESEPLILGVGRVSTRAALLDRAAHAAAGLVALGLRPGEAVALLMRNDLTVIEASIAANYAGAYAVPISWMLKPQEVAFLLQDSGARILIVHADLLAALAPAIPADVKVILVNSPAGQRRAGPVGPAPDDSKAGAVRWDELLCRADAIAPPSSAPRASMIYTSGTTGRPKAVKRSPPTPEQARKLDRIRAEIYGLKPDIRTAIAGPLYHIAMNSFAIRAAAIASRLVVMARFDPEELLSVIEEHGITTLFMVPMMFVRLLQLSEATRRRYDVSSLQHVVHGGAPCPPETKHAMIAWWGPVIHETYGATELGSVTFCNSAEWLQRPGTVGRPVQGATVRILDEGGMPVPHGTVGDVYASVDAYPDFTYHNRQSERDQIERGGLVTTGDVGYLDEAGFLYLCDRKLDVINLGGINVYPAEVELALIEIEGVRDCAAFGIPDATFGEVILALVVRTTSLEESAIRKQLAARLANYKLPARIEFRESLPRDDGGKLRRQELRAPYWANARRSI
jgi:long-chain acyl-CoA synthetase